MRVIRAAANSSSAIANTSQLRAFVGPCRCPMGKRIQLKDKCLDPKRPFQMHELLREPNLLAIDTLLQCQVSPPSCASSSTNALDDG